MRTRLLGTRPRRRIGATLALLVAVGVVVGIIASTGSSSPGTSNNSSTASGATSVQRRDLVETDTESGTLGYAKPQTVYNHMSGTLTWLPSVGDTIKPGHTLFKVAGQPVILMNGTTPAYRDLKSSDSAGQDILELNRNLVDLGFNPDGIVVDDTWQAATTAGVDAFQASLGETQTGKLTLGRVVFLPGDQLVSTVSGTLGATVSDPHPSYGPVFVDLTTPTTTTPTTTTPTSTPTHHHPSGGNNTLRRLEQEIVQLRAELAHMGSGNGNHGNNGNNGSGNGSGNHGNNGSGNSGNSGNNGNNHSGNPGSGGGAGAATAVLQTTSTQLTVTVDLDASKQSEATVGEPVTVEMPAGNTVNGKITAVSPVASSSSNNGNGNNGNNNNGNNNNGNNGSSGSTIPVTISLSGRQSGAGLDQASVSVNFAQAKAKNVLSVPVTALLATGGGNYAVQEAAAPHKLIPVTTGLFAAGYVQISGTGIYSGLQVTDSQG